MEVYIYKYMYIYIWLLAWAINFTKDSFAFPISPALFCCFLFVVIVLFCFFLGENDLARNIPRTDF